MGGDVSRIDPTDVTAETLLLWGAEDEFQPIRWAERLAEDIADAELVGLDEANHWVTEDRPEAYREHLTDPNAANVFLRWHPFSNGRWPPELSEGTVISAVGSLGGVVHSSVVLPRVR